MTKWVKLDDNEIVDAVALERPMVWGGDEWEPEPGWIEAPADVFAGYAWQVDGSYTAPVVEPIPPPVPGIISRRQFYQGLTMTGKITQADALAAVKSGAVPAALQALLDGMEDADARFEADMLLSGATEYSRDHPLVLVIGITQSMSEDDIDDFWRLCAGL